MQYKKTIFALFLQIIICYNMNCKTIYILRRNIMYKLCAFADESSPAIVGQIDALKRNGISLLEIRGVDGQNIKDISLEKAKEVRKMLDDAGISVWSMGSPIGKHHLEKDFEPHMDDYKRIVEYAYVLGAKRIRMFSFYAAPCDSAEATEEKVFEGLRRFCDYAPDDIILCHENEKKIYAETPETCVKILKAFPKMRAVFDPANFVQCGVDTLHAWDMLKDYVDYMHIKDAIADGTVVPAGKGLGNVPAIVKDYLARGGSVMTLEPHLNAFTGLDKLEDGESLKQGFSVYKTNEESFDAAVSALNGILANI